MPGLCDRGFAGASEFIGICRDYSDTDEPTPSIRKWKNHKENSYLTGAIHFKQPEVFSNDAALLAL